MKMNMRYIGKIIYRMTENHPDWEYSKKSTKYKYTFEDNYFFNSDIYGNEDVKNIKSHIKNDLMLVAGGGYSTEHIIVDKVEIIRV